MRVLVTGANGYIGSHLVQYLADSGYTIHAVDNLHHGEYNDIRHLCASWRICDITHSNAVSGEYDAVVHLAGRSVVPDSLKSPYDYYHTNIVGTKTVLDYVDTGHFLFASTSSAVEMASPYAISKVAAEQVIREATDDYTIFRFFNVSGTTGEYKQLGAATHLIRVAAEVAAGKRNVLEIYGDDYDTPDGTCVRDYVHVVDLVAAIERAIKYGPQRTHCENLGSSVGYSVLDVVAAMERVTGKTLPTTIKPRRAGDAVSCIATDLSHLMIRQHSIEDMCASQLYLESKK